MKFLVERTLLEGIRDAKKYFPNISDEDYIKIIQADPTYKQGTDNFGTYGKWLLNLYKQNKLKLEDLYKATEYLTAFEENKRNFSNKDIGQFKSLPDLKVALDNVVEVELSDRQKLRQVQKSVRNTDIVKDAEKVFEDNTWVVYIPKTYEASCKLGQGTEWCTATTSTDSYYETYSYEGPLYININKSNGEKYQFHFESGQFMDKNDSSISLSSFFLDNPSLFDFYEPKLFEHFRIKIGELGTCDLLIDTDTLASKISNRNFTNQFISDCFLGDIAHHWYGGEYIYNLSDYSVDSLGFNEKSLDDLRDINISRQDLETIIEGGCPEHLEKDFCDDIRHIILMAANDAAEMGSIDECLDDFETSLDNAVPQCAYYRNNEVDGYLTIKFKRDDILALLGDIDDVFQAGLDFEDLVIEDIADNFSFNEPQYGWQGYNEEYFNTKFQDDLYDLIGDRE